MLWQHSEVKEGPAGNAIQWLCPHACLREHNDNAGGARYSHGNYGAGVLLLHQTCLFFLIIMHGAQADGLHQKQPQHHGHAHTCLQTTSQTSAAANL